MIPREPAMIQVELARNHCVAALSLTPPESTVESVTIVAAGARPGVENARICRR